MVYIKKITILFLFLCIAVFLRLFCISRTIKPTNQNVILITLDACRADHLKCYGYSKETSPFIDEFANDAFLFEKATAQSASTVPSLASMFTSKYPYTDCVVTESFALGKSYLTIAEFLKKIGYETYAIVGNAYASKVFGFARGFDYFDDRFFGLRYGNELTKAAIKLLKKRNNHNNFFLWLHYREPHSPYRPPQEYAQTISKKDSFSGENSSYVYTIYGCQQVLSKKEISELADLYDLNIRFADDNLRELFEYLRQSGLLRTSIIILTADHGESLGEHYIFDHNELYYGILRVPLIIKIPHVRGRVIRYPVALIDIFPTILDLLGYKNDPVLKEFRGKNIFYGKGSREGIFSEYSDRYSLIVDNFRLFHRAHGEYELYDIKSDPCESANLVAIEKKAFGVLKKKLISFLRFSKCPVDTDKFLLDAETKKSLKSLGYSQ